MSFFKCYFLTLVSITSIILHYIRICWFDFASLCETHCNLGFKKYKFPAKLVFLKFFCASRRWLVLNMMDLDSVWAVWVDHNHSSTLKLILQNNKHHNIEKWQKTLSFHIFGQ